jgi:hypothetical protein
LCGGCVAGQHRAKVKVVCKDEDFHGYAHTQSSFLTLNSTQTRLLHIDKYMRVCVWNRLVLKDWGEGKAYFYGQSDFSNRSLELF